MSSWSIRVPATTVPSAWLPSFPPSGSWRSRKTSASPTLPIVVRPRASRKDCSSSTPTPRLRPGPSTSSPRDSTSARRSPGPCPSSKDTDGVSQHRWQLRRLPTTLRLATGRSGAPAFAATPAAEQPVAQPAAAAWLVRRSVWQALGGFDEAFAPAWWEDVDFCARLEDRSQYRLVPGNRGLCGPPGRADPPPRWVLGGITRRRGLSHRLLPQPRPLHQPTTTRSTPPPS